MTVIAIALALLMPPTAVTERTGDISHNDDQTGRYLALPCKHGNIRCDLTVELCGPAACEILEQTDYGPSQRVHPDRIADVAPAMFEHLCGKPAGAGLCRGSWRVVDAPGRPRTTLPPTDTAPHPERPPRGVPAR